MSRDMTKPTKWLCTQRRLRSALASAQSDPSLRCALNGYLRTQAFFMRTAKTLIRLGGFPGWSESSLGTQSFCWFRHVAAQIAIIILKFEQSGSNIKVSTVCRQNGKLCRSRLLLLSFLQEQSDLGLHWCRYVLLGLVNHIGREWAYKLFLDQISMKDMAGLMIEPVTSWIPVGRHIGLT